MVAFEILNRSETADFAVGWVVECERGIRIVLRFWLLLNDY